MERFKLNILDSDREACAEQIKSAVGAMRPGDEIRIEAHDPNAEDHRFFTLHLTPRKLDVPKPGESTPNINLWAALAAYKAQYGERSLGEQYPGLGQGAIDRIEAVVARAEQIVEDPR